MNDVWKALDPIFQTALRTYVATGNQQLFGMYAQAVGFNPEHIPLLYLTLQIELQFRSTNNSNPTTDINQYFDATAPDVQSPPSPQQKQQQQVQQQTYSNTETDNQYHSISVLSDNAQNTAEEPSITIINVSNIDTETTQNNHNNNSNNLGTTTTTCTSKRKRPADSDLSEEARTQKRRKVCSLIANDDDSNLRKSNDMKQEVMSSSAEQEIVAGTNPLGLPSLHSSVFDAFDVHNVNAKNTKRNRKAYKGKPKTQPALPVLKMHRDPVRFDRYYDLIRIGHNLTMHNQKEDESIHKYQLLKQQQKTRPLTSQNTSNIAQSNKKKIGRLLAPLK